MRIAMIGKGYIGPVSGACLSDFGHRVTCIDKGAGKIDALIAGRMPICEPGLAERVISNAGADGVFIAVGTPARRGDAMRGDPHGRHRLSPACALS